MTSGSTEALKVTFTATFTATFTGTFTAMQHQWNFRWVSGRVSSADNLAADLCSRWGHPDKQAEFWAFCSQHNVSPTESFVSSDMFQWLSI